MTEFVVMTPPNATPPQRRPDPPDYPLLGESSVETSGALIEVEDDIVSATDPTRCVGLYLSDPTASGMALLTPAAAEHLAALLLAAAAKARGES